MEWSVLSTPKSSGYSPGSHLSATQGRGIPRTPELLLNTLTIPSLVFGVFSHFLSWVTLWSWNLQREIQDQDPNNKIPVLRDSWRTEGLFLDMQFPL